MDVLSQVRQTIRRHNLIARDETVVVGVSGGPDSVCLLHALMALRGELGFDLHVAHLNHQLRGADADADANFVGEMAAHWQLRLTSATRDVAGLARQYKLSVEEAARHARYGFLAEVAQANHGRTIAVAHNADDQAESVLMHFLRGSGTAGLRGMLYKSKLSDFRLHAAEAAHEPQLSLVRPLLDVPRTDVDRYCREHNLEPRMDASNLDTTFFRNRLRHELLPLLETYNPNIREILHRTADVVAAEVEIVRDATHRAWHRVVAANTGDMVRFRLAEWRSLPSALQRSTLREAIHRLRPSLRNINFVHVDAAVSQLQNARTGAQVTLPDGLRLVVEYDTFTIAPAARKTDLPDWPFLEVVAALPIVLPGTTPLPDLDWSFEASWEEGWSDEVFANPDPWTAYLDAGRAGTHLKIRTRRMGDVFHPQGMPAPVRLTDWMTNIKIPRRTRDRLPLVIAGDRIAWVAGFRIGQPFAVTRSTRRVLRLCFRHGSGN
jgi:tRNA(Ile)-lysidine synthase